VGELVVLTADGRVAHLPESPGETCGLERELAECLVLDPVLAGHLLHEELRVGDDLADLQLGRALEAGDEAAVLGDVVRRDADRLPVGGKHRAVVRLEYVAECGGPWIPACAAVGEEAGLHETSS